MLDKIYTIIIAEIENFANFGLSNFLGENLHFFAFWSIIKISKKSLSFFKPKPYEIDLLLSSKNSHLIVLSYRTRKY